MSLGDKIKRYLTESHPDGEAKVHFGDPRFDDWPVVRDFDRLPTARAFQQVLAEAGMESALTSDWPLDADGRGDIALRVPPGQYVDADELLGEP